MAVFSRIVILAACVVSSALFVDANTENVNAGGQVTARHLKHAQPRAHHAHVAHGHAARSNKRSADKKRACAAKTDAVKTIDHTTTTTKSHTTTTKSHTTTTTKHTTTTTQAAVSTKPASTGGKAGLGWNDGNVPFLKNLLTTGKVTWCYTWSPWTPGGSCEFVPMLWSGKQTGDWNKNIAGKSFKNVLAFNEPEISGQSEMSVGEAVGLWHQYIKPMNARHGAPAVTTSPKGIAWITDFLNQCGSNCEIDFLCFHYYGMDPDNFISTIEGLHKQFPNYKIWITEWACQNYGSNQDQQCSLSTIKSFLAKSQAWLDSTGYIERYAWFGALTQFPGNFNTDNRLITPAGALTDLGRQYMAW